MTPADLDKKSESLDVLRRCWEGKILPRVARTVSDARAHAGLAVTKRLRAARDGRPSLRVARAHPSMQAATARLDELHDWLVGPGQWSLAGTLRDAREEAYRTAHTIHRGLMEAEGLHHLFVTPDPAPTRHAIDMVRGHALHGYDLRDELGPHFEAAARHLAAAVHATGARGEGDDGMLDLWETRTRERIADAVATALGDGILHADTEAGRDLIHPDWKDEE